MTLAYLGLGANLGEARQTLQQAIFQLTQQADLTVRSASSLYRTEPIEADGPDYYNCVVALETQLTPHALLTVCQHIEAFFKRQRSYRNAPRTLDLDILLYSDLELYETDLVIPHPRLTQRAFVLIPLLELNTEIEIPQQGRADAFLATVAGQRIEKVSTNEGLLKN